MALKLRQNNPFNIGFVTNFNDGTQSLDRPRLKYIQSVDDEYHTVSKFDTLEALANKFYSDAKFWWILNDINDIFNPFELTVGDVIVIPNLDRIKATAL